MEIIISGRHLLEVDDDIKSYTEEKMRKLENEYPRLISARVVMDLERSWRVVEGHVHANHLNLDAKAKSQNVYTSIDGVVDKLERQLRRYLEKVQNHHVGKPEDLEPAQEDDDTDDDGDIEEDYESEEISV